MTKYAISKLRWRCIWPKKLSRCCLGIKVHKKYSLSGNGVKMVGKREVLEKKTVLFVDDDEAMLRSLERRLLDESYNKLFAKNSKEALEILRLEDVHVIVTDMCMPEMTGLELLRIARREYPNIIGIVITGYDLDAELQKAVDNREVFRLVTKPLWKLGGKFERLVRWALEHSNLRHCRVLE